MNKHSRQVDQSELWTYDSAPNSPALKPLRISSRQLRRWTEQRRVDHLKIAHRVYFTDEQLAALAESFVVRAVR